MIDALNDDHMSMNDPFASSAFSTVCAWIMALSVALWVGVTLLSMLRDVSAAPRAFKILGCVVLPAFAAIGPLRYAFWQVVFWACFPFQSWRSFLETWVLVLYLPILWVLLLFLSYGPFFLFGWLAKFEWMQDNIILKPYRLVCLAFVGVPLGLLLWSSPVFNLVGLPVFGESLHWLRAEDVIRASNGPAYLVFRTVAKGSVTFGTPPEIMDRFKESVSAEPVDSYRAHIALTYLSKSERLRYFSIVGQSP